MGGLVPKAVETLTALLQRDPENKEVSSYLRVVRHLASEIKRIDSGIAAAFKSRDFEAAITLSSEGAALDSVDKQLSSRMLLNRGKARHSLAKSQMAKAASDEEAKAAAHAGWRKSLHDLQSASYHDESSLEPFLVRAEVLQGLERWEEAVLEIKDAINKGPGQQSVDAHNKLNQAEFLVRKSKRPDLYAMLGVQFGCKASEREIRAAYKQQALIYHPDKQGDKPGEEKAAATAKFKELGDVLEVLTDPYMKQLWDEGHCQASIKQQV